MTVTDYDDIIYTKLTRGLEMTLKLEIHNSYKARVSAFFIADDDV